MSVHSFATDPFRGIAILLILASLLLFGLILFLYRIGQAHQTPFSLSWREMAIMANSLFLTVALFSVLTGTLYPIFFESVSGEKIAVGAPFFEKSFVLIMLPLLFLMPLAPFLGLASLRRASKKLLLYFTPIAVVILLMVIFYNPIWSLSLLGLALAFWIMAGALLRLWHVRAKPLSELAMIIAHLGLGLSLAGMIGAGAMQIEKTYALSIKDEIDFVRWQIRLEHIAFVQKEDYRADEALLSIYHKGVLVKNLHPQTRYYIARPQPTREAAIWTLLYPLADLHAILGDKIDGKYSLKFYYNPLAPLLWLGALLMVMGGLYAFIYRLISYRSKNV